jgi:hypothetical protein
MPNADDEPPFRPVTDAEFRDEDIDPPPRFEHRPQPPSKARFFWPVFWVFAGIGAVYLMLGPGKKVEEVTEAWPPGFSELLDCTFTASLDGTRELELTESQQALFRERSANREGIDRTVDGKWSFDELTKLYYVTLDGEVTRYSLAKPTGMCMLIKGDLGAADLRASWFASVSDHEPEDDSRQNDDRH